MSGYLMLKFNIVVREASEILHCVQDDSREGGRYACYCLNGRSPAESFAMKGDLQINCI